MTDALRQELRGQNVRITAIYPPNIEDVSPLEPEEWNALRFSSSWISNRDVVEATFNALNRARHVSFQSVMLESDGSNFHSHT